MDRCLLTTHDGTAVIRVQPHEYIEYRRFTAVTGENTFMNQVSRNSVNNPFPLPAEFLEPRISRECRRIHVVNEPANVVIIGKWRETPEMSSHSCSWNDMTHVVSFIA